MPFSHDTLAVALAAVFIGYLLFGISGFGASFVTVPVLSYMLPPPLVLSIAVMLDLAAALLLGVRFRRDTNVPELARMVPFTVIGSVLGLSLLISLPKSATLASLIRAAGIRVN